MPDLLSRMTDQQVLDELRSYSLLNRVRRLMTSSAAGIEQALAQRRPVSPVEVRRMEFDAARKLIALVRGCADAG